MATGGFFERNTYRITALGWLKKKERRKKERKKKERKKERKKKERKKKERKKRKKERKKERKKKMNDSDFRPFQVCHFKIVTTHCYYNCRLGQAL